ncbi:MAG TPA: hypothetical protein VKY42_03620 [Trueperaceae bacterium]|nr:hypothetical protein [Trueperaceae bacterium]
MPDERPPDTLVELAKVVASLPYDEFLKAVEKAGIERPTDLLGRAHVIAGLAQDRARAYFASSALERDVDNGLAYEFARGDVAFITVRDPSDPSRGFTFSLTLSGREYPNMDVWAFGVSPAKGAELDQGEEEPLYRLSLSFFDLEDYSETGGPVRVAPPKKG